MVVKNGSKSRIRKETGSLAPTQPSLPKVHRIDLIWGLGVMVATVTTSISIPIHMRFAWWSVTPPLHKRVIEKANHLPGVEVLLQPSLR